MMLDNLAYAISSPLAITQSGSGAIVSWPTNSPGFTLQESFAPSARHGPTLPTMSQPPAKPTVSQAAGSRFYRLKEP
jgi:hypothetical protein